MTPDTVQCKSGFRKLNFCKSCVFSESRVKPHSDIANGLGYFTHTHYCSLEIRLTLACFKKKIRKKDEIIYILHFDCHFFWRIWKKCTCSRHFGKNKIACRRLLTRRILLPSDSIKLPQTFTCRGSLSRALMGAGVEGVGVGGEGVGGGLKVD